MAACVSTPEPAAPAPRRVMWPLPPDQPRYLYEATLRNASDLRDPSEISRLRRTLVGEEDTASLSKPFAVAARAGRVYVSDSEARRIFVFDLPRRRTFSFGFRREGELKKPAGLALDGQGRVYVVDSTARRVVVFDALGLFLGDIDGHRQWVRPTAVAVSADAQRLYVVDTGGVDSDSHCLWRHGEGGVAQGMVGKRGSAAGEFNLPADAAIGPDGTLWVLDAGNFRVQAFDAQDRFVAQFGSVGNGLGQLARPRGLAIDDRGLVYVSDAAFCNVQVFRPDGQLLLALGSRAERRDAPGRYLLPAKIAFDETGRLYVVDQYLHKVEIVRRLADDEGRRLLEEPAS